MEKHELRFVLVGKAETGEDEKVFSCLVTGAFKWRGRCRIRAPDVFRVFSGDRLLLQDVSMRGRWSEGEYMRFQVLSNAKLNGGSASQFEGAKIDFLAQKDFFEKLLDSVEAKSRLAYGVGERRISMAYMREFSLREINRSAMRITIEFSVLC